MKLISLLNTLLLCVLGLLMPTAGKAQPKIAFDKTQHNFGVVEESENYIYHKFIVTNKGNKPLVIDRVETSCGCTSPEWTKDSIMPGQQGYVQARYETIKRVGPFTKSLTVYSNADIPFVHLDIKGEVKASEHKADPEDLSMLPFTTYGYVSLNKTVIDFGPVQDNAKDTQTVIVTNESEQEVVFYSPVFECKCLSIADYPAKLEPHESKKLLVIIDGAQIPYYGANASDLSIKTNHPSIPYYGIRMLYNKKEYFPKMSKSQLKKAPHLNLDNKVYSWDTAISGDILKAKFVFTNTGKKPLKIREIRPSCGCVTPQFTKQELAPGESADFVFFYDTVTKHGNASQKIDIITNDPSAPEVQLLLKLILAEHHQKCLTCPPK